MIDVIIPAYNSHEYIFSTLKSIAKQTIKDNIVVTIVDDGSKKQYNDIASSFPELKTNIIRLRKNKGQAYAKQVGINNTYNKYIAFIDSDDILMGAKALEKLYTKITSNKKYKIAIGKEYCNGKNYYNEGHMVAKLFTREIITKYKIKIPRLKMEEDTAFTTAYCSMLKKEEMCYIKEVIYKYNQINPNSITKKYNNYTYKEFFKSIDYAYKYIKKYKKYEYFKNRIFIIFLYLSQIYFQKIINQKIREDFLVNSNKFYNKYYKFIGDIPISALTRYSDIEYDIVYKFWKILKDAR